MKSHDGMTDALTHFALPAMLYEEVQRELARAKRGDGSICGVKICFSLPPSSNENANEGTRSYATTTPNQTNLAETFAEISDREILLFAQSLRHETRGEDICARMGSREFLVLLIDFKASEKIFVERFISHWQMRRREDRRLQQFSQPEVTIFVAISLKEDTSLDFLNRIDLATPYLSGAASRADL